MQHVGAGPGPGHCDGRNGEQHVVTEEHHQYVRHPHPATVEIVRVGIRVATSNANIHLCVILEALTCA